MWNSKGLIAISLLLLIVTAISKPLPTTAAPQFQTPYPPLEFATQVNQVGGTVKDVFVVENSAFVSRTDGTVVYDISDIQAPIEITKIEGFTAKAQVGNYLYGEAPLAEEWQVWDIADPLHPVQAGAFTPRGFFLGAGENSLAFLYTTVEVYSLAIPTLPKLAGRWNPNVPDIRYGWSRVVGNRLFLSHYTVFCDRGGCNDVYAPLAVIDLTNPATPTLIGTGDVAIASRLMPTLTPDFLYQTDTHNLFIYRIEQAPVTLTLVATMAVEEDAFYQITAFDSTLYLAHNTYTSVVDISDPTSPSIVTTVPTVLAGHVYGTYLFGVSRHLEVEIPFVTITDIQNPSAPTAITTLYHVKGTFATKSGDALYIVDLNRYTNDYIHIVDVSNPDTPIWKGTYPITTVDTDYVEIVVYDEYLYLVRPANLPGETSTLDVYKLPTETEPLTLVNAIPLATTNTFIKRVNNILFFQNVGMDLYTLTDPTTPTLVATLPIFPVNIVGEGNYAYVLADAEGVSVIDILDIRDSATPVIVAQIPTYYHPDISRGQMEVVNGYLYYNAPDATLTTLGLYIADVHNPSIPAVTGPYAPIIGTWEWDGSRLYTQYVGCNLMVRTYTLDAPLAPHLSGVSDRESNCANRDFSSNGDHYYVIDNEDGVRTFEWKVGYSQFLPTVQRGS